MSLSLSDRLARYAKLVATTRCDAPASPSAPDIDERLAGLQRLDYPGGSVYCRDSDHHFEEPFGQFGIDWERVEPVLVSSPHFLAEAQGTLPESWAFVDCETTGLSGGVGTMAFLIAVGRPAGERLVIKQFFLAEPADERGLLEAVTESLQGARVIWTYNGTCFDLPLLETRFRFWRMDFSPGELAHVDLLTPTRVLFRRRIGDCSLASLEEQILKVARVEDLPGAEVPAVYFEYLQTGRSPRLHRVFEHNRVDVLSLAVYASYLLSIFHPRRKERLCYPEDVLSLARYHLRRREWEMTKQCLRDAEEFALGPQLEAEYHRLAAYVHKRCGDFERASHHFSELARHPEADTIGALEELAKHCEHRQREFREALRLVERAIALADRALMFGDHNEEPRLPGLYHRRARLRRKLARHEMG